MRYQINKDEEGNYRLEDTEDEMHIYSGDTGKFLRSQNWVIMYGKKEITKEMQDHCDRLNLRQVWGI